MRRKLGELVPRECYRDRLLFVVIISNVCLRDGLSSIISAQTLLEVTLNCI
jgi:hypothetical protein